MKSPTYWLDLFTGTTWQEFLDAGGNTSGFRESRWKTVQQISPGDYLICYLTGLSRLVGLLEVTNNAYYDEKPLWKEWNFPCRLAVKLVIKLTPETAVPITDLRERLSIFENLDNPNAWTGHLRGSPSRWKSSDGEVIRAALLEALDNPIVRAFDPRKLARRPPLLNTKIGDVTIPSPDEPKPIVPPILDATETADHLDIQYRLLKLGTDMGFDVWVARNDRNRELSGKKLADMFTFKNRLPVQFDEATTKTIEYIDVLWLKGNAIVAAFEVESTTSIYSGLLRMSDLIAMQPNINVPLYLVAPDERRDKVFMEVNRPTFSRLSPPLVEVCRYISFSTLRSKLKEVEPYVRYLKSDFLQELAEDCGDGDL